MGDVFGGTTNCHSDGYARFDLPPGSRLVGTQGGPDGHAVLDVGAAMDALTDQASGSPGFVVNDIGTATTPGGQEVARRGFAITAGGGVCELLESPDGTHLLISGHSD